MRFLLLVCVSIFFHLQTTYGDSICIRAFDLGGGGLKTAVFSYDTEKKTMHWIESKTQLGICPEGEEVSTWLRARVKQLLQKDLDKEIQAGYRFGFSLAGLNKLRARPLTTSNIAKLCAIPEDRAYAVGDATAHTIASVHELGDVLPEGHICNFSLGTGIGFGYVNHKRIGSVEFDGHTFFIDNPGYIKDPAGGMLGYTCSSTHGFDLILSRNQGKIEDCCFQEFALKWKLYLDLLFFKSTQNNSLPVAIIFTGGHIEAYGSRFVDILRTLEVPVPVYTGVSGAGLLGAAWNVVTYDATQTDWMKHILLHEEEKVKTCVENGAEVNTQNALGYTPLSLAIQTGQMNLVQFFVSHGAWVNKQDALGFTSLALAVEKKQYAIAEFLLSNQAYVNREDCWERSPLFLARKNKDRAMENLLLQWKADP